MSSIDTLVRASNRLPDLHHAHWLLRIMLAAIIMYHGFSKAPLTPADASSFGVPMVLWVAAAVGEVLAGLALLVGGAIRHPLADLTTRLGGLMLAVIVASVLVVVYWAPPLEMFLFNQLHLMLLVGGVYFALRGNSA